MFLSVSIANGTDRINIYDEGFKKIFNVNQNYNYQDKLKLFAEIPIWVYTHFYRDLLDRKKLRIEYRINAATIS